MYLKDTLMGGLDFIGYNCNNKMEYKNIKILELNKLDLVEDIIKNITFKDNINIILNSNLSEIIGKAKNIKIEGNYLIADLEVNGKAKYLIDKELVTTASIVFIPKEFKYTKEVRIITKSELLMINLSSYQAQEHLNNNLIKK